MSVLPTTATLGRYHLHLLLFFHFCTDFLLKLSQFELNSISSEPLTYSQCPQTASAHIQPVPTLLFLNLACTCM